MNKANSFAVLEPARWYVTFFQNEGNLVLTFPVFQIVGHFFNWALFGALSVQACAQFFLIGLLPHISSPASHLLSLLPQ
jgi:hypothetical protein